MKQVGLKGSGGDDGGDGTPGGSGGTVGEVMAACLAVEEAVGTSLAAGMVGTDRRRGWGQARRHTPGRWAS